MIIAVAGRRVSPPDDPRPRFPESRVDAVLSQLESLMRDVGATALVSSGAQGTDLLAMQAAGQLDLDRWMVLPFDPKAFRESSVVDETERRFQHDWGRDFDKVVSELATPAGDGAGDGSVEGGLIVLGLPVAGENQAAYDVTNDAILDMAERLARQSRSGDGRDPGDWVLAVVVWEGEKRGEDDHTWSFKEKAEARNLPVRVILTEERGASPRLPSEADKDDIALTRDRIEGASDDASEMREVQRLINRRQFGAASRVLSRARAREGDGDEDKKLRLMLAQKHAFCIYKDPDLPASTRLDRALEVLKQVEDLKTSRDQETLGLAGAIYKRKWEVDGQPANLERSLAYYLRGYREGVEGDQGYTAVNAAFALDLLASQDEKEALAAGTNPEAAGGRRAEARRIREAVVTVLPDLPGRPEYGWLNDSWWYFATLAEAHFGLGRYDEAARWLRRGATLPVADWQFESTARQLVALGLAMAPAGAPPGGLARSPAGEMLRDFLGDDAAFRSAVGGKVGLALSGGGFRAALFHIGVLARLAELDVLRHVEVLSCVSGGSIVGAHYYLQVRNLLQSKSDSEVTRDDYVRIVRELETEFLAGVQRNIRMRVVAHPLSNLRTAFLRGSTRTAHAGELFESEIFARVGDGQGSRPRWLNDLMVRPLGAREDFSPKLDNWRRRAKVPILILNATPLNTGHNWQFTTSWMGEPPSGVDPEVDGNDLLRWVYYRDAPGPHGAVRLGHAVAASACVPGLFEPLVLDGLYPDRTVRLVDGGVHDNQGVAGLLDQDCSVLLVSDASGQMQSINTPRSDLLRVSLRSNNILQARVRAAQYVDLASRRRGALLRGLMFVHLKKDLDVEPVDWIGCPDPSEPVDPARSAAKVTRYGVLKDIQRRLAAVRTDLDSFSDREAFALMYSGYAMTKSEMPRLPIEFQEARESGEAPQRGPDWRFLTVERAMTDAEGAETQQVELLRLLGAASHIGFKVWRLSPALRACLFGVLLGGTAVTIGEMVAWYAETSGSATSPGPITRLLQAQHIWVWAFLRVSWAVVLAAAAVYLGGVALIWLICRVLGRGKSLGEILIGLGLAMFGFIPALIHLLVFDRIYLAIGRVNDPARHGNDPAA